MKTPQFEELATRWGDKARFYILYTREAHPRARGQERLAEFAKKILPDDDNGDGVVTREEFSYPAYAFEPFDIDNDGRIVAHELLAATRVGDFGGFEEPKSYAERVAAAKRFRAEVPGAIPVLIDTMDNSTKHAYASGPNSAFVIAPGGKVEQALRWASVRQVDAALRGILGPKAADVPALPERKEIQWSAVKPRIDAATAANKPLLLHFTAPGCPACETMKTTVLAEPQVIAALEGYEHAVLGVQDDSAWGLFDALDLGATPAFVVVDPSRLDGAGAVLERRQGLQEQASFLAMLQQHAAPAQP